MKTIRAEIVKFDSTRQIREDQDALVVPAILTRESILPFGDGRGYRPAAEVEAAAWTLEGAWVVAYDHILTVFPMSREDIRGKVENVKFDTGIHGVRGDIRFLKALCDQALLEGVRKGDLKDVSVAYFSEDDFTPGEFGGEPYDFVQRNFMFGHVAAGVPEGRCPSPFCGMNVDSFKPHKDPEETANFIHIPIRDKSLFIDGSDRTITLSADEGIEAVVGKLKSDPEGSTVIQKYMFAKAKEWTMEKAQAWVREHKDTVDQSEGLSVEEIKQKISDVVKRRQEIIDKLYPKGEEEKRKQFENELALIDAEIHALEEVLAQKLIEAGDQGGLGVGGEPRKGQSKSDKNRLIFHIEKLGAAVLAEKLIELFGDEAFKLLPEKGSGLDQEEKGELEKKREEAAKRCARTPITFNEGKGSLTKPEEYQNVDDEDFADPCNYNYPMVPEERLRTAWQRLHQEENRSAGDYTVEEWEWMKNRVEKRLKEKGAEVKADSLDPVEVLERSRRLLSSR